jgi:predicted deacetylase
MASYLVRFDDLCPTMNWAIWDRIEELLVRNGVKPILGVIPDNQDRSLHFANAAPDFWDRVRKWQSHGWTIGMHGYQHRYTTSSSGLVGIKDASEFAALPVAEQRAKLEAARAIFQQHGVTPEIWVAPGHSFDRNTVSLLPQVGIRCLSDGLFFYPRMGKENVLWVPQQAWRFRKLPFGVWTICFHHSHWNEGDVHQFAGHLSGYRSQITSLVEIVALYGERRPARVNGLQTRAIRLALRLKLRRAGSGRIS